MTGVVLAFRKAKTFEADVEVPDSGSGGKGENVGQTRDESRSTEVKLCVKAVSFDFGSVLIISYGSMLAEGLLDLVQAALAVTEGVKGGKVGSKLLFLGSGDLFFNSFDVVTEEIEEVAFGLEIILCSSICNTSKESSHSLVRLDHNGEGLIGADGGDAVDDTVFQAFGDPEPNVWENAADMFGQGTIDCGSKDRSGFPTLPSSGTESPESLEIVGVSTTSDSAGKSLKDGQFVFPFSDGLNRGRQFTAIERGFKKLRWSIERLLPTTLSFDTFRGKLLGRKAVTFNDKDKSQMVGTFAFSSGLKLLKDGAESDRTNSKPRVTKELAAVGIEHYLWLDLVKGIVCNLYDFLK